MKMTGNTVLVTGGASGIGLALAERFLAEGNEVILCGRRESKLAEAKERHPEFHTRVCDVSVAADRAALVEWVTNEFPAVNVLVNNAGIQQRINLNKAPHEWDYLHQEIAANFDGPVHLTNLFLPHFLKQEKAAFVNVSSGLAITPAAWAPIYCATKAGLHSFTLSLRLQLADTGVDVVEILPPAVNTDLGGPGLHTFGAPVDEFADAVFAKMKAGQDEIGYGGTEERAQAYRAQVDEGMKVMYNRFVEHNPQF